MLQNHCLRGVVTWRRAHCHRLWHLALHRSDGRWRPILVDPHRKLEVQSPIQRLTRQDLFLTAQKVIKRTSTKAPHWQNTANCIKPCASGNAKTYCNFSEKTVEHQIFDWQVTSFPAKTCANLHFSLWHDQICYQMISKKAAWKVMSWYWLKKNIVLSEISQKSVKELCGNVPGTTANMSNCAMAIEGLFFKNRLTLPQIKQTCQLRTAQQHFHRKYSKLLKPTRNVKLIPKRWKQASKRWTNQQQAPRFCIILQEIDRLFRFNELKSREYKFRFVRNLKSQKKGK